MSRTKRRSNNSRYSGIVALLVAVLAIGMYVYNTYLAPGETVTEGSATVYFIDVGQGDAALVMTDGGAVLVDAGPGGEADKLLAEVKKHTDHLACMILSHAHEDHIGGADDILNELTVDLVLMSDMTANTSTYNRLLTALEKEGCPVEVPEVGQEYTFGTSLWKCLGPVGEAEDLNNSSLVFRMTVGGGSILFTGDMETKYESAMLEKWKSSDLRCDVLKAGHHGSSTSSSKALLDAVSPKYVVISCGVDNDYGHPHRETIKRYNEYGFKQYRTDEQGTVTVHMENGEITFQTAS